MRLYSWSQVKADATEVDVREEWAGCLWHGDGSVVEIEDAEGDMAVVRVVETGTWFVAGRHRLAPLTPFASELLEAFGEGANP